MNNAFSAIWQTLVQTPWWVYVILIYVLWIGVKALKPRVVSLKRLVIVPIVFLILSFHSLCQVGLHPLNLISYLIALIIGAGVGFWLVSRMTLSVDSKHGLIKT